MDNQIKPSGNTQRKTIDPHVCNDSSAAMEKLFVQYSSSFFQLMRTRRYRREQYEYGSQPSAPFSAPVLKDLGGPKRQASRQVSWSVTPEALTKALGKDRFSLSCNLVLDFTDFQLKASASTAQALERVMAKQINNFSKLDIAVRTSSCFLAGESKSDEVYAKLFRSLLHQILLAAGFHKVTSENGGVGPLRVLQLSDVRSLDEAKFWTEVLTSVEALVGEPKDRLILDVVVDSIEGAFALEQLLVEWEERVQGIVVDPVRLLTNLPYTLGQQVLDYPVCIKSQWSDFSDDAINFIVDTAHRLGVYALFQSRMDSFSKLAGGPLSLGEKVQTSLMKKFNEGFDGCIVSSLEGAEKASQIFRRRHQLHRRAAKPLKLNSMQPIDFYPLTGRCSEVVSKEIFEASIVVFSSGNMSCGDEKMVAFENLKWLSKKLLHVNPDKAEFLRQVVQAFEADHATNLDDSFFTGFSLTEDFQFTK